MKKTITLLFLICSSVIYSQNGFESWDETYRLVEVSNVLETEKEYAKKVEADPDEGQYYIALRSYRFLAKFTGRSRNLRDKNLNSMRNVLKMQTGSAEILNGLVSKEFEFKINDLTLWLGIQNQLIEPFLKEVDKDQDVLLYTMFTNEHKFEGGYINTFLISEFTTNWSK
ncbi:hypothetical protein G3567_02625 [Psychroflexus sp. YR1-1]|uniref:Uncharacterized protein n=1 Tax=Psychroflexus aurantiacus TaxID=2709310 RepID=A0A6B3R5C4_9FLAO|nr:hypothetical protein [Psychroflexus aurantiacus]NEV93041.1 hypothetical protein [Psychroflexus aurantiacus]